MILIEPHSYAIKMVHPRTNKKTRGVYIEVKHGKNDFQLIFLMYTSEFRMTGLTELWNKKVKHMIIIRFLRGVFDFVN